MRFEAIHDHYFGQLPELHQSSFVTSYNQNRHLSLLQVRVCFLNGLNLG